MSPAHRRQEHHHTPACDGSELTCSTHEHDSSCYDGKGNKTCTLPDHVHMGIPACFKRVYKCGYE